MEAIKPIAWLGDPDLKEQVLLRMKQHRAQDSIVQGLYQQYAPELATKYRGCLLGCTLPQQSIITPVDVDGDDAETFNWHQGVEDLYGIDVTVAYVLEHVFESLSTTEEAADFAVASIEAIPVGADLSQVSLRWRSNDGSGEAFWVTTEAKDRLLDLLRNAPVPALVQ